MDDKAVHFTDLRRRMARRRRVRSALFLFFGVLALVVDIWTSVRLNENPPDGDAKIYSRMAVNVIDHHVFSVDEQPNASGQVEPSIIRLPGYPLFLAAVYSFAGNENYTAVRAVQGTLHFFSAVIASLIAFAWTGGTKRRRRVAAFITFILAAFCPFTVNYSAVLLTEIVTIFLMVAMMLAATYAIKSAKVRKSVVWWILTGLLAGAVVEVRPDSGLFALGLGLTLIAASFVRTTFKNALGQMIIKGVAFALAFILVLTPWTVRNERVFGQFQPLAPQHAEAPGEFVPLGYFHWLRTWIDDFKYVNPMLWELEIHRIDISKIPPSAFTNDEEKAEVAALIDQYNNSDPDHPMTPKKTATDSDDNDNSDSADSGDDNSDDSSSDDDDNDNNDDQEQPNQELDLKISPESDAQFEKIAERRIANQPFRYYVVLPAERAATMWFDTHSEFYPFAGEIFPLEDIDSDANQQIWLPLFAAGVWLYTLLALLGIILMWASRWRWSRIWVTMALLIALPRIAFFGTLENPEPRYLMELFLIAAILGGIAISRIRITFGHGALGLTLRYGRDRNTTN
jgi:hypothetical protein